ncbi:MAG: hypothetical protein JO372_14675 [Solirubrobacterales bacterium]|nr:hypothetical protein [Solirubrobacterales bacterium]
MEPVSAPHRGSRIDGDHLDGRSAEQQREDVSRLRGNEDDLRALFELAGIGVAPLQTESGILLNLNDRW